MWPRKPPHREAFKLQEGKTMPTIEFSNAFDATNKRVLSEVFSIVIKKLDLTEDFKVKVSMEFMDNRGLYARVARGGEKLFLMEMNSNGFNLFDATAAFGHELIHVQQHIKGWLRVKDTKDIFTSGMHWKGEFYSALHLTLNGGSNCVPWEIDAWKRMGELHKYVVSHLPPTDAALVDITKSIGLKDIWNADYAPWKGCEG